ncbi:CsbD family protein [uncultured Microbacterium sp.]|uniref:CsbD family protein n=1 Tax=uncultured Microbacterium sp. TaxID=191216 RepID=UPI0025DBC9D0|nr:CsbD family protein [uncultured Microbacterium sp.]
MGFEEKADAAGDKFTGKVKETAGDVTGNDRLAAEGRADQAKGHIKDAAEKVKDAVEDAAENVKKLFDKDK